MNPEKEYGTTVERLFGLMEKQLDAVTAERDQAFRLLERARDQIIPAMYAVGRDEVQLEIANFLRDAEKVQPPQ